MANASALNADSALYSHNSTNIPVTHSTVKYPPVMIILTSENVDVQRHPGGHGKGVEDMGEHLRREVSQLLALDTEVRDAVRSGADIYDRPRQRLRVTRPPLMNTDVQE